MSRTIEILSFINSTWNEYDEERFELLAEDDDKEHKGDQNDCLTKLSANEYMVVEGLMKLIREKKIKMMDKEDMFEIEADGFFVNTDGSIVIFSNR